MRDGARPGVLAAFAAIGIAAALLGAWAARRRRAGEEATAALAMREAHLRSIWIEPNLGGGVIFKFTVRLAPDEESVS